MEIITNLAASIRLITSKKKSNIIVPRRLNLDFYSTNYKKKQNDFLVLRSFFSFDSSYCNEI